MEAVLYAARDGALALLPGCFKPCRDLEQSHGAFRACGRIEVDDVVHRPLWRRILADFDRCGYALLNAEDADNLFGSEGFWGFSDRREFPREEQLYMTTEPSAALKVSFRGKEDPIGSPLNI